MRDVIRRKHYSIRTEQAYIDWIKRFIIYHGKRHLEKWPKRKWRNFCLISHVISTSQPQLKTRR